MPRTRQQLIADLLGYTDTMDGYLSDLLWEAADALRLTAPDTGQPIARQEFDGQERLHL